MEHGLIFELYNLTGKIMCKCGKEFKEKEELFKHLNDVYEDEEILTCKYCGKHLIGMKEVRKHYDEEKHYSYQISGTKFSVCFL